MTNIAFQHSFLAAIFGPPPLGRRASTHRSAAAQQRDHTRTHGHLTVETYPRQTSSVYSIFWIDDLLGRINQTEEHLRRSEVNALAESITNNAWEDEVAAESTRRPESGESMQSLEQRLIEKKRRATRVARQRAEPLRSSVQCNESGHTNTHTHTKMVVVVKYKSDGDASFNPEHGAKFTQYINTLGNNEMDGQKMTDATIDQLPPTAPSGQNLFVEKHKSRRKNNAAVSATALSCRELPSTRGSLVPKAWSEANGWKPVKEVGFVGAAAVRPHTNDRFTCLRTAHKAAIAFGGFRVAACLAT